jgi:hypothetical protein
MPTLFSSKPHEAPTAGLPSSRREAQYCALISSQRQIHVEPTVGVAVDHDHFRYQGEFAKVYRVRSSQARVW